MFISHRESLKVPIDDSSQVGEARREAAALATRHGFGAEQAGKLALVVTELSTNLVKHAGHGELVLQALGYPACDQIEVLSLDKGPGMRDVARCLEDGYSTAGSPGTGLGAIVRQSDAWDIFSAEGQGTAVVCRINSGSCPVTTPAELGAVCLPRRGEAAPGDRWAVLAGQGVITALVADGLGHGPQATDAAVAALDVLRTRGPLAPLALLEACHGALRPTRGAAVTVVRLEPAAGRARACGVGNATGALVGYERSRSLTLSNGIVGHEARRMQEYEYPLEPEAQLVLQSDGLATSWRLDRYPGLLARHPALLAGVLYRDFSRGNDDVTVLAVRPGAWA